MRGVLPPPRCPRNLKKTSICSPMVKMGLKTIQNNNFWTFLAFPAHESRHKHFRVTTSPFLSSDINILNAQHNVKHNKTLSRQSSSTTLLQQSLSKTLLQQSKKLCYNKVKLCFNIKTLSRKKKNKNKKIKNLLQ